MKTLIQVNIEPYCITDSLDGYFLHPEDIIDLKYLGKSKVNIEDLFKTENK
jgi:hypothetical protein